MNATITTLRVRVALAAALAAAVVLVGVGSVVLAGARRDERAALDGRLQVRAEAIAAGPLRTLGDRSADQLISTAFTNGEPTSVRLVRQGVVVRGQAASAAFPVPRRVGLRTFQGGGRRWRAATVRVRRQPGSLVEVAVPLSAVDQAVAKLRRRIVLVGLIGLLVAAALAFSVAGWAVRSLGRLRADADEITSTDELSRRVDESGPTEVAAVARALNAMLGRIEQSAADREQATAATRRFAADAGHELRAPLAVMQANLETLVRHPTLSVKERRETLSDTLDEHQRLIALVAGLQSLTRGDGGAMGDETLLDLGVVAGRAASAAGKRFPAASLTFHRSPRTPKVHGSPAGLGLLADNLVANAVQHGGRGGPVTVRVTVGPDSDGAALTVEDSGPGIPAEERERVTERFVRGSAAAGDGSGLGLAIAAQQAERSGGELRIDDSPLGGARVTVTLPGAP